MDTIKWLRKNGYKWSDSTLCGAAYFGDVTLINWLKQNGCPYDKQTARKAAMAGHIQVNSQKILL